MKIIHRRIESIFEKITAFATLLLGSAIPFVVALGVIIYWISRPEFYTQSVYHIIKDMIHALTFLSLFIIQKEFNRFSGSLHVKVNELIVSHKPANNAVINADLKTEHEIAELTKQYVELAADVKELEDEKGK